VKEDVEHVQHKGAKACAFLWLQERRQQEPAARKMAFAMAQVLVVHNADQTRTVELQKAARKARAQNALSMALHVQPGRCVLRAVALTAIVVKPRAALAWLAPGQEARARPAVQANKMERHTLAVPANFRATDEAYADEATASAVTTMINALPPIVYQGSVATGPAMGLARIAEEVPASRFSTRWIRAAATVLSCVMAPGNAEKC